MQSRQREKIYIDTNVWFSYITRGKYDPHFEKAEVIINDIIKSNECVAIISHLSLLELVNSIRNKVVQRAEYKGKLKENINVEFDLKNRIDKYIKCYEYYHEMGSFSKASNRGCKNFYDTSFNSYTINTA